MCIYFLTADRQSYVMKSIESNFFRIQGLVSQKVENCKISDLSYDHLPTKFATKICRNVFTISDLRPVVMTSSLCGGTKIDQFTRAAHLSDKFICIYSFKQNIEYSYFIGLCRYKSRDTLRK